MAYKLYDYGRNEFVKGNIRWKAGGDAIKAFLIKPTYTIDLANHKFLSDIPEAARIGNAGGTARADAVTLTLLDPTAGICDAEDATFTAPPQGLPFSYVLIFKDDGLADSSSPLIVAVGDGGTEPLVTNGADVIVEWANTVNKIFKI